VACEVTGGDLEPVPEPTTSATGEAERVHEAHGPDEEI
jgi:hypothetical protein